MPVEDNLRMFGVNGEAIRRIIALERQQRALRDEVSDTAKVVSDINTAVVVDPSTVYGNQNYLRNGDFDLNRNRYIYETDTALGTVPADVSEEAAHWFVHARDVAVETTGAIDAASATLTINNALFESTDNGVEIVVEGAGTAGADLVTTISGAPSDNVTATLFVAASTTVTDARVRFRLLTRYEDSTDNEASVIDYESDGDVATNSALKTTSHSRYATTPSNPDYDQVNGWVRMSDANYVLAAPLPHNYITASKHYTVSFKYRLAADVGGEVSVPVGVYMGFWDSTPGKQQYLEGLPISLTATPVGTTGSTVREYYVILHNAGGETIGTEKVTVSNSNATLSASNYVSLEWDQPDGIVRSEIYRKTGDIYERLLFPYPAQTYLDRGATTNIATAYPDVDYTRQIAYLQSTPTAFANARSDKWRQGQFRVPVPADYAVAAGGGKQWFVFGLQESITGSSSDHALLIDLVSVDDKYGIFTRCPLDFLAKRQLSISPSGGSQGGGGGPIEPGGGGGCPVFDALIDTDQGKVKAIDLVDNSHNYRIINRNGIPVKYSAQIIDPQTVFTVMCDDKSMTASGSNPCFTDMADTQGTKLIDLREGDKILHRAGLVSISHILRHTRPRHTVKITLEGPEKGFWQDDFGTHNEKPIE
jgi:hypothetical protein